MVTLLWNDKVPLDKDVRKCLGKIINYNNHLNHKELADIQTFTKQHMINWALTTKWLNHNAHGSATSDAHSKDVAWKIKTSTITLPTLGILNRNFPDIIKNRTDCLPCNSEMETNHHIWRCPVILPRLLTTCD